MFKFRSLDTVSKTTSSNIAYSHVIPSPNGTNSAPMIDNWDEALETIEKDPESFACCSPRLQDDMHIAYLATQMFPENLKWASETLRNHALFVLNIIKHNIEILAFAGQELLADSDFILKAVNIEPQALLYCDMSLLSDPFFMAELKSNHSNIDNWINLRKNVYANRS